MDRRECISYFYSGAIVSIKLGDLTEEDVDAIVCPANSYNHMRGGVAGVIRCRGGDEIEEEAMQLAPVPIGQAVCTGAGKLKAKNVIHSPTMTEPVEECDIDRIIRAVVAALNCANQKNIESISFPGMGTGTGGVLFSDAASAMISSIKGFLDKNNRSVKNINIVCVSNRLYDEFVRYCDVLTPATG